MGFFGGFTSRREAGFGDPEKRDSRPLAAPQNPGFFSIASQREAALRLGLSSRTLERNRASGFGPAFCKLGRRILYRPADLDAWITSHIRTSTSDTGARQ
jgi:hypothetical protein